MVGVGAANTAAGSNWDGCICDDVVSALAPVAEALTPVKRIEKTTTKTNTNFDEFFAATIHSSI